MKFLPEVQKPPVREEQISEDGNFRLSINHDPDAAECVRYGISVVTIDICPGHGFGKTIVEAMENSKASLLRAAATIQERIAELDTMIEEEAKVTTEKENTNEMD